jgi:guanyl-specific ribonuclease Sa
MPLLLLLPLLLPWHAHSQPGKDFGEPQISAVEGKVKVLPKVKVIQFGKVVYEGPVDVNPTLQRVRNGKKLNHRNDGAIFGNREGLLPRQKDRQYYREFVHTMKGLTDFPGPQRVILGKKGEVFYTGDHYSSFERVR